MAYVNGVTTANVAEARQVIDVSKQIGEYVKEAAPFSVILQRAKKDPVTSWKYQWYDDEPIGMRTQVKVANSKVAGDDSLSIDVNDATIFNVADLVKVGRTGEVMRVTAITDADTIKVTRAFGTTAIAALQKDDWLYNLGGAFAEMTGAPDAIMDQPTMRENVTQITKTTIKGSGTLEAIRLQTAGNERNRQRRKKSLEHMLKIERALLYGEKNDGSTGGVRATGGALSFITTNVMDVNGILTEAGMNDFARLAWSSTASSPTKLLCFSPEVGAIINQFAANKIETATGDEAYGLRLKKYNTFFGTFLLAPTRVLELDYADMMLALDIENIFYRPLKGRDTQLRVDIHNPDLDGWMDEYLTEFGLQVEMEKTHAYAYGITG